jgi:hypothetical protein
MNMPSMTATSRWRRLAASLVALSLFTALTISLTGLISAKSRAASAASATSAQPQVYQPSGHGTALAHGVVDLSKLPTITPQDGASAQTPLPPRPDSLSPAQRQAYSDHMRQQSSTPLPGALQAQQLTEAGTANVSPNFVGGGAIPVLGKQFDGLNSTQAGGGWATMAIATDVGYVMQGTTNALAIYSPSSGATLGGPYSAQSFFAPVYHSGFTFFDPQMYFDVMAKRWIVAYLESDIVSDSYLDVAVSQTASPTQQYNVYQFSTDFRPNVSDNVCNHMALGVDYWGIYLSCTSSSFLSSIIGNTVLAINKAPLLTGAPNPKTWYWNDRVKIANDVDPAFYVSPTIVEGQQDAEFVVAIDTSFYFGPSSNITVCAVTNQSAIATAEPLFTCLHANLGYSYSYPIPPRLPGGTVYPTAAGFKQVYYKAGHLFLAWASASKGQDVIDYAEFRPVLRQKSIDRVEVMAAGTGTLTLPNEDLYDPAIVGTDEDDIVLVFNSSGPSTYPSIKYTGRKATDPDKVMGQGTSGVVTFATDVSGSASGAEYAACAISMNSATRGSVWCASQYIRPGSGWSTRIYNLHAE